MPTDRAQDTEAIRAALRWVPWHRVVAPELGSPHTPIRSEAEAALGRLVARLEAAERALREIATLRLDEGHLDAIEMSQAVARARIQMQGIARAALAAAAPGETEQTP